MRESIKDPGRLRHMLDMAELLQAKKSCYTLEAVRRDPVLFYGLTKIIEIIGEAAYMITTEFKKSHPVMPWREMEGMRHVLVHGYYTVRPEVLWDVIENDIPAIVPILREMLK